MTPMISIVTPSLNQGCYVRQAIESVLAQNDPNFEHIIVDGGSEDETLDVLADYAHLRVICEPDRSQADAVNKGFARARGHILGEINADDYYLPGCFAVVRREMQGDRPAEVVTGGCDYVRDGQVIYQCRPKRGRSEDLQRWFTNGIAHPSTFFTRDAFHRAGGFDPAIRHAPDLDLWLRMAQVAEFRVVPEVLAVNRCHGAACQCRQPDANAAASLFHIARHGSFEAFSEMLSLIAPTLGRGSASETINGLATAYVCTAWALLGRWNVGQPARIALYGAGTHTQWLLRVTAGLPGPHVVAILSDAPAERWLGWPAPLLQPAQLDPRDVDAVVVSSDSYEQAIATRAREHFGDRVPQIRLYEFIAALPLPKDIHTPLGRTPTWLVEASAHPTEIANASGKGVPTV
jgi:hypothetical protein